MSATVSPDLIKYVDTSALEWEEAAPGSRRKTLFNDPVTGERTSLIQWDPGYHVANVDEHPYGEYLYILSGTFVDQNRTSGPGTYIHNRPGSSHQPHTPDGCTFLVIRPGKRDTG
ncbi:MAG TPA: cupin domain-containing protein [Dehalococcoidia bacterium]|nr:cupin domain-containing protein [Dehalococcoidia bacterium]